MSEKGKKGKKSGKKGKTHTLQLLTDNAGIKADSLRFTNRELSWLDFNERVLYEARDSKNPLLERLKFLSITASNLDEFFVIRVASLKDMVNANYQQKDFSGLSAQEQLDRITKKVRNLTDLQYSTYTRALIPALRHHGIDILHYEELDFEQKEIADEYFSTTLYPILSPMGVDVSRPFPLLQSQRLNMAILIEGENEGEVFRYATVQIPAGVPRLFPLKGTEGIAYLPIEELIRVNLASLFRGSTVLASGVYRIMRNADLDIDEDEASDLLKEIEEQVRMRQWGEIIRLECEDSMDSRLLLWITQSLSIDKKDTFPVKGALDLTFLMRLYADISDDYPQLCYPPYTPQPPAMLGDGDDIFEAIRNGDILLHHPFESFEPVIDLIRTAARDPNVLAIKQTLYRVSSRSPIIRYLAEAAENGKQVMVLVELKARFDEENNINWAKMLEKAGCHVIYGLVGLKTHSKITLVVRNEEDKIRRYLHLGTGNYNDSTAKVYTDLGLLTCSEPYGVDASEFFNMISGYAEPVSWNKLIPAPLWLRDFFVKAIRNETRIAKEGKKAMIIAKANSLLDGEIIELLYEASCAGVKIHLIIRGICCLRSGVKNQSENITVNSIVGRYLEHSRIFYFHNEGARDIYIGSADWMPRNLDRRVELIFPVEDETCRERIMEILSLEMEDTLRSHWQNNNGTYSRIDLRGKKKLDSQAELCAISVRRAKEQKETKGLSEQTFIPAERI